MHKNITQANVHGLQETRTKLTRTHKMLALSELQQIATDISFIYIETEKCTVTATHLAHITYHHLYNWTLTCTYQLPWNENQTPCKPYTKQIMWTIHNIPILKAVQINKKHTGSLFIVKERGVCLHRRLLVCICFGRGSGRLNRT